MARAPEAEPETTAPQLLIACGEASLDSQRHHTNKRNFEIIKAPCFIAAALLNLSPKGQQTVRHFNLYSNKSRRQNKSLARREGGLRCRVMNFRPKTS
jgi:hypothetical protein